MIAIKEMEMPDSCRRCEFLKVTDARGYCIITRNTIDAEIGYDARAKDCPLVEIIACKDCKHRDKVHPSWLSNKKDEVYFCTLQSDEYCYEVEDDFYCADGERRE